MDSLLLQKMQKIHSFYYIQGPWRAKQNFCCFICVSYGPYTLLQNDSFFYIYITYELRWYDTHDIDSLES